jgi:hypothetical protein
MPHSGVSSHASHFVADAWHRVTESLISGCYYTEMTKNLGNASSNMPRPPKGSALGRLAPALFPLVVVGLGYLIGWKFFGF